MTVILILKRVMIVDMLNRHSMVFFLFQKHILFSDMKIHQGRKYAHQVLAFIPGLTARESQPTLLLDEIAMLKTPFLMVCPGLFFMRFVEQVFTQFYTV